MAILERQVQHVYADKWVELEAIDKEFSVVEAKHGYPPKKRYQMISGPDEIGTLIVERQWASFAAMEEANEKFNADPEIQTMTQRVNVIVRDIRLELYATMP
jgi:hypothetical protein